MSSKAGATLPLQLYYPLPQPLRLPLLSGHDFSKQILHGPGASQHSAAGITASQCHALAPKEAFSRDTDLPYIAQPPKPSLETG